MKILVLGAKGFVGKNLTAQLYNIKDNKARWYTTLEPIEEIYEYDFGDDKEKLNYYYSNCSLIYNLFEANVPIANDNYRNLCNKELKEMVSALVNNNSTCPIITGLVSVSKQLSVSEEILLQYLRDKCSRLIFYRFQEIFGKWSSPNFSSSVSKACYDIANNIPFLDRNLSKKLTLNYIDDVVDELIRVLCGNEHIIDGFGYVPTTYQYTLGDIVNTLKELDRERTLLKVPRVSDPFIKALYSTYLSFLPDNKVSYELDMKNDDRGSFTEFIRTNYHGQISINISKPGIIKGQHWHNNRVEKFLVVSGRGLLQQRRVGKDSNGLPYPVFNSYVSSDKLEVVEVRPGFTHNLINLSSTENLVTIIWGNDCFDPNRPDTYFEKV